MSEQQLNHCFTANAKNYTTSWRRHPQDNTHGTSYQRGKQKLQLTLIFIGVFHFQTL